MTHLRAQDDLVRGACGATKIYIEKLKNSINPLKGACAPMRGNSVGKKVKKFFPTTNCFL